MYGVYFLDFIIKKLLNISHLPRPLIGTEAENPGLHNPLVITEAILQ